MTEIATLGGGCFGAWRPSTMSCGWRASSPGTRAARSRTRRIARCTGTTGHAEVVQVTFDPEVVSFREILEVFFTIHDPTTLNRQGADVGPQYRSAIFYHDEEQRRVAEDLISDLEAEGVWDNPIVTEVTPFEKFFVAETTIRSTTGTARLPAVLPGRYLAQDREVPHGTERLKA